MPKVSVCIPTYNTERYLGEAIESVLAQECADFELVVCDNASTDGTPDLCARYGDPRLRYVRYEALVNQAGNWNRCLELAQGEYVALLHADDCYLPNFLGERVQVLDARPEVGLAFGAVELIDGTGAKFGESRFREEAFIAPAPEFYRELLFGCVINPVSPLVRRSAYQAVGGFRTDRLWGIDAHMWMRLAARFAVAYSPTIAAAYRIHDASGTADVLAAACSGPDDLALLQEAFDEIRTRPDLACFADLRGAAFRNLGLRTLSFAGHTCERGNLDATRQHLRTALTADPSLVTRPTTWTLWIACHLGPGFYRGFRRLRGAPGKRPATP